MKKFLLLLLTIALVGCTDLTNTPQKKVETFFSKYQTLDKDVLSDLDRIVAEEETFNTEQREKYKSILKKHYQCLTYDIKDYKENGDEAVVTVEIEVTDYSKAIAQTNLYLENNLKDFLDVNGDYDIIKFNDYRLEEISKVKDKVKYTFDLRLTKTNDKWELNQISKDIINKINGIYIY